jgi:hypothetical protein
MYNYNDEYSGTNAKERYKIRQMQHRMESNAVLAELARQIVLRLTGKNIPFRLKDIPDEYKFSYTPSKMKVRLLDYIFDNFNPYKVNEEIIIKSIEEHKKQGRPKKKKEKGEGQGRPKKENIKSIVESYFED